MGGKPEIVGKKLIISKTFKNSKPFVNSENTQIISSVIYIDHFGNVITNIKKSFLKKLAKEENLKYQQEIINSIKYIHHIQILSTLTFLKIKEATRKA